MDIEKEFAAVNRNIAGLARRTPADDIFQPGPIDLVERTRPTPPPPFEYGGAPWFAAVLICAIGAMACIAVAIWLGSTMPAITECPL